MIYVSKSLLPELDNIINTQYYRIRISGNVLGKISDVYDFLQAIEINYVNIFTYQKIISKVKQCKTNRKNIEVSELYYVKKFYEYQEIYDNSDILLPDEHPSIVKINYNSPGFWEVIASWNPFEQIREYIKERHARIYDKKYKWKLDVESKQIENNTLRVEFIHKLILELREIGMTDDEIKKNILHYFNDLDLLNPHIDDERVVDISIVDKYDHYDDYAYKI